MRCFPQLFVAPLFLSLGLTLPLAADETIPSPLPPIEELEGQRPIDTYTAWLCDRLGQTVDDMAVWLDSRFGAPPAQREGSRGYIRLVPFWSEYDGFELEERVRVRVDLPNIDKRLHAVIGTGDRENFEVERPMVSELQEMSLAKRRFSDQEFLARLGYSLSESSDSALRFSTGIRVRFPVEPYARLRYTKLLAVGERNLLHFHQTIYTRTQRGEGSITGFDFERVLSSHLLARASVFAHYSTWDERPEEYGAELSLARAFARHRMIAASFFYTNEPRRPVVVPEYGVRFVYRKRLSGERLFGELHTGVTWPRDHLWQERERSFFIGLGVELRFSASPDRAKKD